MVSYLCLIGIFLVLSGISTEIGGVEGNKEVATDEPTPGEPNDPPDFIIYVDDTPCVIGTINVSFTISYKAQSGILSEIYTRNVLLPVEDDPVINGTCEGNTSSLSMSWWDGLLGLNFTFVKEVQPVSDGIVKGEWWVSEINVVYDTSNSSIFPEAIKGGPVEVSKNDLVLFKSPLGMSFFCDAQERIVVGNHENAASLSFHHVRLQPFMVKSEMFSRAKECDADVDIVLARKDAYIVPVIVACCLAAICIIVVIGYAISRKVNKYQEQSSYKPMD